MGSGDRLDRRLHRGRLEGREGELSRIRKVRGGQVGRSHSHSNKYIETATLSRFHSQLRNQDSTMIRFDGKVAIITGGAGGIGSATCRRFAAEGASVAVFDRDEAGAQKVASEIDAGGGKAKAFVCDITDRKSIDAAVLETETALGPIAILVNNAGFDIFKPFLKTEPDEWERLIAVNLRGPLHMHHAVLPGMAERKYGRIVNIASDAARVGSTG